MSQGLTLVGRDAELARLHEWIDDLGRGVGRTILVEGEPGIGKSSLVRSAADFATERGCHVYWAAADELGQDLPLQPFLDALDSRDLESEPRLTTIRRLLQGELVHVANPTVAATEQMLALMTELCSGAPSVLVIDDLQWADTATINVWQWLVRVAERSSLLLVGIMRPIPKRAELLSVRRCASNDAILHLEGLSEIAVIDLIERLAGGRPGEDLIQFASGAAGNPLYLTELISVLARSRRLDQGGPGPVHITDGPVPGSLMAAIADRLSFLSGDVRSLLQAAALLGMDFLVADVAVTMNRRVAELVPAIHAAIAGGILKEAESRLQFRHPLIRDALYNEIGTAIRGAWHRDAARALAEAGASVPRVARQLLQAINSSNGGQLDGPLLDWLIEVAPVLSAQAPNAAIELLRQAVRRSPMTTARGALVTCRLAHALYQSGECAEAEHVAAAAVNVVTDIDLLVDLYWTISRCQSMLGRAQESIDVLTEMLARPAVTLRHRARFLVMVARAHRNLGAVAVAHRIAIEALAAAEEVGDQLAIGWSLHVLTISSLMRGDVAGALPLFERALKVVDTTPELSDLGMLLQINQAVAFGDIDRYPEAIEAAVRVRQRADLSGNLVRLAQAQSALGELLFEVGRWDEAQAEVEVLSDEFKDPGATCADRGVAAVIAFHRGDSATAKEHLAGIAQSAGSIGNRVVSSLVLARSLDRETCGAGEEALMVLMASINSKVEELDEMEDLLPEAVRLATDNGSADVAKEVTDLAMRIASRSQVPHRHATAAYCRGLLDDDPYLLSYAADRYSEAGRPLQRAKALEAASVRFAARGDRSSARTAFIRADDLYNELGANWDIRHLRAQLRRHGIRRGPHAMHRRALKGWDSLTPTETRVAALIAEGLANRQIAAQLVISTRTVETHVSHIIAKLGVRSRVDIAREVAAHRPTSG